MNDSHDTISNNNTTIVLNGKSLEDLTLSERKATYRKYCQDRIRNGIITPALRRALDDYALELDLLPEDRKEVEQLVRHHSASASYEMNPLDRDNLELIKETVAANEIRIGDMLPKLEAMSAADDDEVQFYYNLLQTVSSPATQIRKYTDRELDMYWQTFWTYVAFLKNGQKLKAETALRELTAWDTQSHDNLQLLQAAGALVGNDVNSAGRFLSKAENCSYLLSPLENTIKYLIDNAGQRRLSTSPEVNFYLEKIFGVRKEEPVRTYSAPVPEPLKGRLDEIKPAPAAKPASSPQAAPAPASAPRPAPAPKPAAAPAVSRPQVPSPAHTSPGKKSSGGKYIGIGLAALAVAAVILFLPRKNQPAPAAQPAMPAAQTTAPSAQTAPAAAPATQKTQTSAQIQSSAKPQTSTQSQTATKAQPAKQTQAAAQTSPQSSSTSPTQAAATPARDPIAELRTAAEGGNKDAQYDLGMRYYEGNGVTKDYATAFRYLSPLAEAGYVKAYFPVAEMYHGGRGVAKDRDAAEKYYQKAADAGNARAKSILINSF
ncbi:MAG: sel1 repeat family protein [Bacteroidales bacterium]|nr:sel1 repeat family protein [Bacteroidales bacterium]